MDKNLFLLLLISIGILLKKSYCTCVLDSSEIGVSFICKFKKTGLFRVRNLGGIQAHIDFGFEAGDAFSFKNSYANTDITARRSIQNPITFYQKNNIHHMDISTIPPFKPMPMKSEINKMSKILQIMKPVMINEKNKTTVTDQNLLPTKMTKSEHNSILSNTSIDILESAIMSHQQQMKYDHFKPALKIKTSLTSLPMPMPFTLKSTTNKVISQIKTSSPSSILTQNEIQPKSSFVTVPLLPEIISTSSINSKPSMIFNDILLSINERNQSISRKNFVHNNSNLNVIMNAPREYYPFGYDKNFDDNFTSRIELPKTLFRCGDQKYFPGLYANEEFGCMVFHVCALTDNGLIMKSFLCPESTLFDQSILKCNWWFYVDCKKSKHLYDSNIPISKSYQLMKALTFFSSYKSNEN